MQTVNLFSEVEHTMGAIGYSVIEYPDRRMTMLFLRDDKGWLKSCVIAPAETLREVIF